MLAAVVLCTAVVVFAWPVRPGVWTLLYPTLLVLWLMPRPSVLIGREVFRGRHAAIRSAKVIIDETQIRMEGVRFELRRPWSHFDGWIETDTLFSLRGAGHPSALWNKEAFALEDLPRLRALLEAQIKPEPAIRRCPVPPHRLGHASRSSWPCPWCWCSTYSTCTGGRSERIWDRLPRQVHVRSRQR